MGARSADNAAGNTADYRHLFLHDVPMMDVRAPVEFAKGAFPGVLNLPLMNDAERQAVGTCYKQHGQAAAIALGHRLVAGETKAERIAAWSAFARAHPQGLLYCFRGGLRSQIVQQWLKEEAGIDYPRVIGGYKAMRGFLIATQQAAARECRLMLVGGLTGAGKTELLKPLACGIDLEGHANHRGSAFGRRPSGQPGQIDFENRLAVDLLKKRAAGYDSLVLEDEGMHIGRCSLPLELRQAMQQAPLVWLDAPFAERAERILRDYVVNQHAAFVAHYGAEEGDTQFREHLLFSLASIAKRLGGVRYDRLQLLMIQALGRQATGDFEPHRAWIEGLLTEYYDPMYLHQQESRQSRIRFAGDAAAVRDYLETWGRS